MVEPSDALHGAWCPEDCILHVLCHDGSDKWLLPHSPYSKLPQRLL